MATHVRWHELASRRDVSRSFFFLRWKLCAVRLWNLGFNGLPYPGMVSVGHSGASRCVSFLTNLFALFLSAAQCPVSMIGQLFGGILPLQALLAMEQARILKQPVGPMPTRCLLRTSFELSSATAV